MKKSSVMRADIGNKIDFGKNGGVRHGEGTSIDDSKLTKIFPSR